MMPIYLAAVVGLGAGVICGLALRVILTPANTRSRSLVLPLGGLVVMLVLVCAVAWTFVQPLETQGGWPWLVAGLAVGLGLGEVAYRRGASGISRVDPNTARLFPPWPLILAIFVLATASGSVAARAATILPPQPSPSSSLLTPTSAPLTPTDAPSKLSPAPTASTPTHAPMPVVTSVSPNCGLVAGGAQVRILGSDLGGAISVTFGGVAGTIMTRSPTQIVVQTPRWHSKPGPVDVQVSTPTGTSRPTSGNRYVFTGVNVTGVTFVGSASNPLVRVDGMGFDPNPSNNVVKFGSIAAIVVGFRGPSLIVKLPPGTGTVEVTVANDANGTSCGSSFIYPSAAPPPPPKLPAPTIQPPSGKQPQSAVKVTIVDGDPNAEIRYTLDATDPTANSALYRGPITVNIPESLTATVRARAFRSGFTSSDITGAQYSR